MDVHWSNCLIEAIKAKFKDWHVVKLIPIWRGIFHFHMMWMDVKSGKIFHFTHKSLPGWHCDLFFKGRIEEVNPKGLKRLENWCRGKCPASIIV